MRLLHHRGTQEGDCAIRPDSAPGGSPVDCFSDGFSALFGSFLGTLGFTAQAVHCFCQHRATQD